MNRRPHLRLAAAGALAGAAGRSSSGDDDAITTAEPAAPPGESVEAAASALSDAADRLAAESENLDDFSSGTPALEANRYRDAADEHSTAVRLGDSKFKEAEDLAPPGIRSDVIGVTCFASALSDGSRRFVAGSRVLADGDRETANDEFEAGRPALDRCESDSTALSTPAL